MDTEQMNKIANEAIKKYEEEKKRIKDIVKRNINGEQIPRDDIHWLCLRLEHYIGEAHSAWYDPHGWQ